MAVTPFCISTSAKSEHPGKHWTIPGTPGRAFRTITAGATTEYYADDNLTPARSSKVIEAQGVTSIPPPARFSVTPAAGEHRTSCIIEVKQLRDPAATARPFRE